MLPLPETKSWYLKVYQQYHRAAVLSFARAPDSLGEEARVLYRGGTAAETSAVGLIDAISLGYGTASGRWRDSVAQSGQ